MRRLAIASVVLLALLACAAEVRAQGAVVQGSVFSATSEDKTSVGFGGGVLYRFNSVLGFGVEATHIPGIGATQPRAYPVRFSSDADASATLFTTNVRVELPTTWRRVIPFAVAGGGVGSVKQQYNVVYQRLAEFGLTILPAPPVLKSTTVHMALTLGGGASVLLTDRITLDADLRVISLMGDAERNIGRFGAGLSYRF